jgi:PTS system ascorbate-specific IIC component
LVGLIACVGLLLQRAPVERVITGSLKAFLGMLIMGAGATVIVTMLTPAAEIMAAGFNFQGVVPVNEAITALASVKYGAQMAGITVGGFVVNLILARFTPLRYIFLSGHHMLFIATVTTVMLYTLGLDDISVLLYGSLISGIVMTMMPALAMPFVHKATNGAGFTLGHLATSGYVLSGLVGKLVGGDPGKTNAEKITFGKRLGFMRESLILMGFGVLVVYMISAIAAGRDTVAEYSGDLDPFVWVFIQSFTFAAGVAIILQGVRMFVGELVPAFRGISDRLVPKAVPALDCPAVFPYGEKSVLLGFFGYTIGLIAAMALLLSVNFPIVIIPILFHSFFMGGTAGVFGNAMGGRRGAFFGATVLGFINSILQAFLFQQMAVLGFEGTTFADTDFVLSGLLIGGLGNLMPLVLAVYVVVYLIAVLVEYKITRPMLRRSEAVTAKTVSGK